MDQWRVTVLGDGGVGKTALAVQVSCQSPFRRYLSISQSHTDMICISSLVYSQLLYWSVPVLFEKRRNGHSSICSAIAILCIPTQHFDHKQRSVARIAHVFTRQTPCLLPPASLVDLRSYHRRCISQADHYRPKVMFYRSHRYGRTRSVNPAPSFSGAFSFSFSDPIPVIQRNILHFVTNGFGQ